MPDWTKGMNQTFEYYEVDPVTWENVRLLDRVTACSITRDETNETLGSATLDASEKLGEIYFRVYLVTIQNGITEKFCLGTFLIQTPHYKYNGKRDDMSYDAYTPLLELKDNPVPLGYFIPKQTNIMDVAYHLTYDNIRVPVVAGSSSDELVTDFVAEDSDTWLTYLTSLIANAKHSFSLDEMSRVIFMPQTDINSMKPVWIYTDDNSSILYPDISQDRDLYGVPNVVEVLYSDSSAGTRYVRVVNDSPTSQTSIVARGREIIHRETSPTFNGLPSAEEIEEYAIALLRSLSTLEYKLTYTHGYCPVRVGDCVLLNYESAGISNVKAKVISQNISCQPGCPVEETAVYTINMWEG